MPNLHISGGANGAGKTTAALKLLPDFLDCYEYVNADSIAQGLSPFKPESVAIQAGRLMLKRLHDLASSQVDFAFETTLASRSFIYRWLISGRPMTTRDFRLNWLLGVALV